MYANLSLWRHPYAYLYYPIFMFRRFVFMFLPSIAHIHLQLPVVVFLHSLYLIWYTSIWPHAEKKYVYLEMANEILFMLALYHMFMFSPLLDSYFDTFSKPGKTAGIYKNYFGYSLVVVIIMVIIMNFGFMV